MPRFLLALLLAASFTAAATLHAPPAAAGDGRNCTIGGNGGDSPVDKACAEGGIDRAKATMKKMIGIARSKQRGTHWACDDCHADEETYRLTGDARQRFKELVKLVAGELGQ